jgi:hypothetical protein
LNKRNGESLKKTVVFNQKVAGYLMLKGFTLKGIEKYHKNPNMNVFIFNDSEQLKEQISKYDNFISSLKTVD